MTAGPAGSPVPPAAGPAQARHAMVATVDPTASAAGLAALRQGGTAVDAALAANAVLAVTSQHLCGVGGDLFAIVRPPAGTPPVVLNASGRAGSGADAHALRAQGHRRMPHRDDIRAVTVPGCVDGWVALHQCFGRRPWQDLLAPAIAAATEGFAASPTLAAAAAFCHGRPGAEVFAPARGVSPGMWLRRPRLAASLQRLAQGGREEWYGGVMAPGLVARGEGLFRPTDVTAPHADWVDPLALEAWGQRLWTTPPNTQGYLTITAAHVASRLDLPNDPDDPAWAHLLIEAAKLVGHDREHVLHERSDLTDHLDLRRLGDLATSIGTRARRTTATLHRGDTTCVCVVDADGMAVSLIQSNASGFGSGLVLEAPEVFLHNRGIGFNLRPGHPAELAPGRRPPHTLSPLLITTADGALHSVLGTMGGDSQPQILLQLLARLLHAGQDPAEALAAGRWALVNGGGPPGFSTWAEGMPTVVEVEGQAPGVWVDALTARGHAVRRTASLSSGMGHAQVITVTARGLAGAADPRTGIGSAIGL
ncbi:MAG TPA: gamma-glutamyltransferase [Euzebya sp.]|nr:gamma-glutamyltransferase [Euzebya sp.]